MKSEAMQFDLEPGNKRSKAALCWPRQKAPEQGCSGPGTLETQILAQWARGRDSVLTSTQVMRCRWPVDQFE